MRKKALLALSLAVSVLGAAPAFAQAVPSVAVRAGAHPDFDRVVFDWPATVGYHLEHAGDQAVLTFDSTASLKFSRDVQGALTRARGFSTRSDGNGHIIVSFSVAANASVKAFTSSKSVVIDVFGKALPAAAASPSAPAVFAAKVESVEKAAVETPKPKTEVPSAPAVAEKTEKNQSGDKGGQSSLAQVAAATASPVSVVSAAAPAAVKEVEKAPAVAVEAFKDSEKAPAVTPPTIPAPVAKPLAKEIVARAKKADPWAGVLSDKPIQILSLDPHVPIRAVIYQRAQVGYVIFDRKLTMTAETLANGVPSKIELEPFDMPRNTGYRFPVPPNSELQATRDDGVWKVFLLRKQAAMPVSTTLVAQPDFALGARFLLPLPDAPDAIPFVDPVVGDNLILIPLAQSEAFNSERHLVDMTILPAAQGLVIKPTSDKVVVRAVSDGVEITAEGGLKLSPAHDTGSSQQSAQKARSAAAGKSLFDFATWAGKPGETFTQTRQRLQQTIVDVPDSERNRARLELARFYFANGLGEESVAMLKTLVKQVPDLRAHADFIGLLGAAEILAYHDEDGLRDLAQSSLSDQPEIELWQAVGLAHQRDWALAEEKFAVRESLLTGYPEPFFSKFFVLAVEAAVAMGNDHEAADWLGFISNTQHSELIDPALAYLRGALEAKAGRGSRAEDAWRQTAVSRDRLYKVRAELALIDLGVATASLTPPQAADRLEALRFAWRGDDLEVDILHRLGQFYIQAKNVKAGLNAMSQATKLYATSAITPLIRAEMASLFRDIFLGELGRKLTPLDSLTLYQQYRDLMPTGKDGDEVMRNLAERLVAVDLLDQASNLLDELVSKRLKAEERIRTALRLAGIRLLDHKPTEALAALELIANETLSAELVNERVLLRARALSEQRHFSEAAALLKDNPSVEAKMLRADIAMHAQDWDNGAKALMELVGSPPANGKIAAEQAERVVNASLAYALAANQPELDKLAIDYGAAMAATPQNDTFRLLTQPQKSGQLRDLAAAQRQISQVDLFQGFLNSYRKKPADGVAKK